METYNVISKSFWILASNNTNCQPWLKIQRNLLTLLIKVCGSQFLSRISSPRILPEPTKNYTTKTYRNGRVISTRLFNRMEIYWIIQMVYWISRICSNNSCNNLLSNQIWIKVDHRYMKPPEIWREGGFRRHQKRQLEMKWTNSLRINMDQLILVWEEIICQTYSSSSKWVLGVSHQI